MLCPARKTIRNKLPEEVDPDWQNEKMRTMRRPPKQYVFGAARMQLSAITAWAWTPPDEIDWSDATPPYLPASIDPGELFSRLKIANHPKLSHGEHRVFFDRTALERVEAHLRSDTSVELGGLLVGQPFYAPSFDAYLVVVYDGYAADEGKVTPASFEYTAETWAHMTPKLQEMPQDYVVVGSYHSHPGIGVFLSSTDINTQVCVFSQPWQIALVIDPIRNETGFFISPDGIPVPFDVF